MTRPLSADIQIVPVATRAQWNDFHNLPHTIYQDDPNWVAPLYLERKIHFDPKHNPFFQHAQVAFWLAYRGGKPVGRITAQIDAEHLRIHQDASGHFGFIEAFDEPAIFEVLLATAENWLRAGGMRRCMGPVSFSLWDEPGLLVEGFDRPPSVLMGHAPPYYQKRIADAGYEGLQDLIAYDYSSDIQLPPLAQQIVTRGRESGRIALRPIRMGKKYFESEIALLLDILNDAWSDNWGFVPMTAAEAQDMANTFRILLQPDYVVIADYDGEPVGFALTLPNLNEAIRDLKGRLLPFGLAKLLWRLKVSGTKTARMPLMGMRKNVQTSSAGGAIAITMIDALRRNHISHGTTSAELSWILDTNIRIKHMITAIGAVPYKRYRIYGKPLV